MMKILTHHVSLALLAVSLPVHADMTMTPRQALTHFQKAWAAQTTHTVRIFNGVDQTGAIVPNCNGIAYHGHIYTIKHCVSNATDKPHALDLAVSAKQDLSQATEFTTTKINLTQNNVDFMGIVCTPSRTYPQHVPAKCYKTISGRSHIKTAPNQQGFFYFEPDKNGMGIQVQGSTFTSGLFRGGVSGASYYAMYSAGQHWKFCLVGVHSGSIQGQTAAFAMLDRPMGCFTTPKDQTN